MATKKTLYRVNKNTGDITELEVVRMTATQFRCVTRNKSGAILGEMSVPRKDDMNTIHESKAEAGAAAIAILEGFVADHENVVAEANGRIAEIKANYVGVE